MATERGISKLEKLEIRKFVVGVWRECARKRGLENLEISWRDSERLFSLFTYSATTGNSRRI
ncbi:hypothetical protein HMPREF9072_01838 [Capnocytophaga sp. oral taxon 324 str. F0483]|nr:hypothetical protein HMPREF9072_01838 [Capnocytophaga sp. oral taxon 324 str. F0483]